MDPEERLLLQRLHASPLPALADCTPDEVRARLAAMARTGGDAPAGVEVGDVDAGGVPARRYVPAADPAGTVVWLHGGGWIAGRAHEFDDLCGQLAAGSGCEVLSVDYRLAPEHPFPAAVEDACTALEHALRAAGDTGRPVVVAGESAGANLATVAERRVRAATGRRVRLQALVCPLVDADFSRGSYRETEDAGHLVGPAEIRMFWDHYVPDPALRADPDCAPLRADPAGAAPAHIVVAGHDPLRDEGLLYAERLRAAGTPVTVVERTGQFHGFLALGALLSSGRAGVADLALAIRCSL